MTGDERRAALERLRPLLGAIAGEADGDPLLLADLALMLLVEANPQLPLERVEADRLLHLACVLVVDVVGWGEPGWTRAAWMLERMFERREFAEVAAGGISSLPEVDG